MTDRKSRVSVDPFRVVGDPKTADGLFVFTCEHATNRVVWDTVTPSDAALLEAHWGYDIGAATIVEALCEQTGSVGILSTLSRLVVDVNRAPHSETLIVTECGDQVVGFNENLDEEEVAWRLDAVHAEYHSGVASVLEERLERGPVNLVSIHSFTPIWAGRSRPMEIGVLFDRHEEDAQAVADALRAEGFKTALNAPYSGRVGELMYAATHHGAKYDLRYLELELRQDLLQSRQAIRTMSQGIARALSVFRP